MDMETGYTSLEVHFEDSLSGPYINLYAVLPNQQLVLLRTVEVGPFPDWEALSRIVMKEVIDVGKKAC